MDKSIEEEFPLLEDQQHLRKVILRIKRIQERILGVQMVHGVEDYDGFFVQRQGMIWRLTEYHCEDAVCKQLVTHFCIEGFKDKEVRQEELKPREDVIVTRIGKVDVPEEMQMTQIANAQLVHYGFKSEVRTIDVVTGQGKRFVVEKMGNEVFDCIDTVVEDNIRGKPFHYRRAKLEAYGVQVKKPMLNPREGDFFVNDYIPYRPGEIGGYFERVLGTVINVNVIKRDGDYHICVLGSKASQKKWQKIGETDVPEEGYKVYDYKMDKITIGASSSHTIFDWQLIVANGRNPLETPVVIPLREQQVVRVQYMEWLIGAVGQGMRRYLYDALYTWPVEAVIGNQDKYCKLVVRLEQQHRQRLVDMLTAILGLRHVRFKVIYEIEEDFNLEYKVRIVA